MLGSASPRYSSRCVILGTFAAAAAVSFSAPSRPHYPARVWNPDRAAQRGRVSHKIGNDTKTTTPNDERHDHERSRSHHRRYCHLKLPRRAASDPHRGLRRRRRWLHRLVGAPCRGPASQADQVRQLAPPQGPSRHGSCDRCSHRCHGRPHLRNRRCEQGYSHRGTRADDQGNSRARQRRHQRDRPEPREPAIRPIRSAF
mmetsp:Transcript_17909/g.40454  ORF Transcript_17909/g.40454 Transcript_17909/m.40454 type:complete len:200 (-) Transcript_17909:471-1070(-)